MTAENLPAEGCGGDRHGNQREHVASVRKCGARFQGDVVSVGCANNYVAAAVRLEPQGEANSWLGGVGQRPRLRRRPRGHFADLQVCRWADDPAVSGVGEELGPPIKIVMDAMG